MDLAQHALEGCDMKLLMTGLSICVALVVILSASPSAQVTVTPKPAIPAGVGDASTTGTLAQFAATTFTQFFNVISDEGTGVEAALKVNVGSAGAVVLNQGTDDTVLVANGTILQAKAVPDCVDSGGNHLNYTAATNAFSCGTTVPVEVMQQLQMLQVRVAQLEALLAQAGLTRR